MAGRARETKRERHTQTVTNRQTKIGWQEKHERPRNRDSDKQIEKEAEIG